MRKFRIDEDTIWEETGHIKTYAYWYCKVYKEIKKGKIGWKYVDGPAIYPIGGQGWFDVATTAIKQLHGHVEENLKSKAIQ